MFTYEPEGISQRHRELASKFEAKYGKAREDRAGWKSHDKVKAASIEPERPKVHCRCNQFIR